MVDELQASDAAIAAAREEDTRIKALTARHVPFRVRLNVGVSGVQVQLHVPKLHPGIRRS